MLTVPRVPTDQRGELYDYISELNARDLQGRLTGEKDITINGVPGREITIDGMSAAQIVLGRKNPDRALYKIRFAVSGTRQYIFTFEYPPDSGTPKEAKVFLESCKILD